MYILSRYAEDEDYADSAVNSVESMKAHIEKEVASFLCFDCGNLKEFVRVEISKISQSAKSASSRLMAVLFYGARFTTSRSAEEKIEEASYLRRMKTMFSRRQGGPQISF